MDTRPRPLLVVAALLAVYLVWGSTYVAIAVAVQTQPPFLLAGARFLVAGALLYVWAIRRGDTEGDRVRAPQWRAAAIVGGLLLLVGNGGVVWAEQSVPSSLAALVIAAVPLWMAVLGRLLNGQRLGTLSVTGVAIGFAGVGVLVSPGGDGGGGSHLAGTVVLCGAAVSWALGSVWSQRLPLPKRPLVATACEMLCGGALLAVVAVGRGELAGFDPAAVSLASWVALAYLVVFGSMLAFSAYVWLLANVRSDLVSTYAYVNPLVAVLLGWSLLDEAVTARTLLGGAVVVAAVGLVVAGRSRAAPQAAEPSPAPTPVASR
jgi:drug/metabolite transporter (DMT)-like permease